MRNVKFENNARARAMRDRLVNALRDGMMYCSWLHAAQHLAECPVQSA